MSYAHRSRIKFVILIALFGTGVAFSSAQDSPVEPMRVFYEAHPGCPDAQHFSSEIVARTPHVRIVNDASTARVIRVTIARSSLGSTGHLVIQEGSSTSNAREVSATSCDEVVSAIALIAALSVDPQAQSAATVSVASPQEPSPASSTAGSSSPSVQPLTPSPMDELSNDTASNSKPSKPPETTAPSSIQVPPLDVSPSALARWSVGITSLIENTSRKAVVGGSAFFQLAATRRSLLSPALRLSFYRTLLSEVS
ncbi:MAG: hypothetical protein NVS3B20_25690 [Polyangiales bacterium]